MNPAPDEAIKAALVARFYGLQKSEWARCLNPDLDMDEETERARRIVEAVYPIIAATVRAKVLSLWMKHWGSFSTDPHGNWHSGCSGCLDFIRDLNEATG